MGDFEVLFCHVISLQDQECGDLILTTAKSSIDSTKPGIMFTIWFRLGYFAVYASPSRLPGKAQDSLSGGAGCAFRSRTYTCKISAAFHSAQLSGTKTHVENVTI